MRLRCNAPTTEVGGHSDGPHWQVCSDRCALHRVNDGCCVIVAPLDDSRPAPHTFGLPGVLMCDLLPARLFLCAGCRVQVLVCSHCDRGQRYCAAGCSAATRQILQMQAGRRYQRSRGGRFKHAARTRRWRERRTALAQKVTHQGSLDTPSDVVLPVIAATLSSVTTEPCTTASSLSAITAPTAPALWRCHWCCTKCVAHVRLGFLRHNREHKPDHGHSP